jgi:hypothetical protein
VTTSRWIKDATGNAVSQVGPGTVVRLEADGAVPVAGVIRVVECPEPAIRRVLTLLGRHRRRPLTTLRWDPWSGSDSYPAVRSGTWLVGEMPPAEKVTRAVALFEHHRSPPLLIGGPVQWQLEERRGLSLEAGGSVATLGNLRARVGLGRSVTLDGTAYAPVDPLIRADVLVPGDDQFVEHYRRVLEDIAFVYRVRPTLMINTFFETLDETFPTDWALQIVTSGPIDLALRAGETVEYSFTLDNVPRTGLPLIVAGFGERGALMSASDLAVIRPLS